MQIRLDSELPNIGARGSILPPASRKGRKIPANLDSVDIFPHKRADVDGGFFGNEAGVFHWAG
jgi:hypothetical protein